MSQSDPVPSPTDPRIAELEGAIRAQDEREAQAGERCGVLTAEHGCDWPDAVAETVIALQQRLEQVTKERDIARDIKALSDSEDRILKNYDAEVAKIREAAEATIARLKAALMIEIESHRNRRHHGAFDDRCDVCLRHQAVLASSEGTERQP